MIIDFHKKFDKRYDRLAPMLQLKVDRVIEKFENNPFDPSLKNHALKGGMKGRRAISVTGDVRHWLSCWMLELTIRSTVDRVAIYDKVHPYGK